VLQPDAALVGGITGLRRVAHLAEALGLVFTPHTWTNGMGLVANAHLVAGLGCAPFLEFPYDPPQWSLDRRAFAMSAPFLEFPYDPPQWSLDRRDFPMAAPFVARDGWVELSEAPGMGYEIDEKRLADTRIG